MDWIKNIQREIEGEFKSYHFPRSLQNQTPRAEREKGAQEPSCSRIKSSRKKSTTDSEENSNKTLEEEEEEDGEEEEESADKGEENPKMNNNNKSKRKRRRRRSSKRASVRSRPSERGGFGKATSRTSSNGTPQIFPLSFSLPQISISKPQFNLLNKNKILRRGWPQSSNTWEPIENLQTCSDVIHAFEERLQKSTRKRKGRFGGHYSTLVKNWRASSPDRSTDDLNPNGPDSGNGLIGEAAAVKDVEDGDKMGVETVQANGSPTNEMRDDEQKKEGDVCISIHINGGSREEEGLVEDGSSKVECVQPLQGAKKRKSGCVRRFKQDAVQPQGSQDGKAEKLGSEDVDSTELDEAVKPPYITKILRALEYHALVANNVQQVSVKFKALRSDGQEVLVDDKDLKANNPLLLIGA